MKINDQDNHLSSIFNRFPTYPTYLPTFDHPLWIGQVDQMMTLSPLDEVTSIFTARTQWQTILVWFVKPHSLLSSNLAPLAEPYCLMVVTATPLLRDNTPIPKARTQMVELLRLPLTLDNHHGKFIKIEQPAHPAAVCVFRLERAVS